jgi:hypothetical protein
MKRYFQIFVVLVLVLAAVGVASNSSAWASSWASVIQNVGFNSPVLPASVSITGAGSYNVGGICSLDVTYTAQGLHDHADSEVPYSQSGQVPFSGQGSLVFPGCHVVHYDASNKIVNQMSSTDGKWKICFGARPDVQTVIYYYLDNPTTGGQVWVPIATTIENGFACADALYTGVYMPATVVQTQPSSSTTTTSITGTKCGAGTVLCPPPVVQVNQTGTYSAGGICTEYINYLVTGLSDNFHVQLIQVQDTGKVPFPADQGLLYLPGCIDVHLLNNQAQKQVTSDQGSWQICFAARPDKTMTIFYYAALDETASYTPPWVALPSTTKDGMVCAPAMQSGIYAPAGK